jgi:hypothetical protein
LQELTRAKIVEHNDETRIYSLTERGKTWELVGTRVLSAGLVAAGGIAQDPKGAQLLEDMAKMAKQNPEFLKVIMNWGLDLLLFFASDPFYESRALKAWGGDKESWALIQAEIDRRTASIHPRTIEEFKVALDDVRTVIIKSLETERRRRGK